MQVSKDFLNIGLVFLSSDFKVVGMNEFAKQVLGSAVREFGESVFKYHPRKSHLKIKSLLEESLSPHPNPPTTMVIDVLNKVLMVNVNVCAIDIKELSSSDRLYVMTFLDITEQIKAETNPHTGLVELKKFPVISNGSIQFLDIKSVYFIQSDGNYCKVFTENRRYYLHSTLKNILKRYTGPEFFRVHRCFVVNINLINSIEQDKQGHNKIVFDKTTVPAVPVSRRKIRELKNLLDIA